MLKTVKHNNSYIIYFIDEDNKTVRCTMYGHNQAYKFITDKFYNNVFAHRKMMQSDSYDNIVYSACVKNMKTFYEGKAKCKDTDAFDENIGMKIARDRMLYKYYKDLYTTMQILMDELFNVRECTKDILHECYYKASLYQIEAEMINNAETN